MDKPSLDKGKLLEWLRQLPLNASASYVEKKIDSGEFDEEQYINIIMLKDFKFSGYDLEDECCYGVVESDAKWLVENGFAEYEWKPK